MVASLQLYKWYDLSQYTCNCSYYCIVTYLSGFFETIKQSHSRKAGVPVEDISIKFDHLKDTTKVCLKFQELILIIIIIVLQVGAVVICGMKLGLAEWDSERGLVQTTKMEQYSLMPNMVCYPVHKTLLLGEEQGNWYPCPLYSSSTKQEFISTIALRTTEQPDHLDLIGIALTL